MNETKIKKRTARNKHWLITPVPLRSRLVTQSFSKFRKTKDFQPQRDKVELILSTLSLYWVEISRLLKKKSKLHHTRFEWPRLFGERTRVFGRTHTATKPIPRGKAFGFNPKEKVVTTCNMWISEVQTKVTNFWIV